MTAADHANTVREILDAEGTFIYRRDEFLDALDALQAQAEQNDWAKDEAGDFYAALKVAETERDRLADALREYENPDNWDTEDGPPFVWVKDSDPPRTARAALAGNDT